MPEGRPNILVTWGDDIGISNLSCYSDGLMGYHTPNIDRIANGGMRFTDSYGEQSCTAGRVTAMATMFLETFKEFPPMHEPASFSVDQAVEKLQKFLAKD
ncbi:MAG TPA: sulfatase-like hydrolase/transferase [Mycobacterium sp.]|nr:sulfatase-like hydrolase/transferase [Mycobacterium sp.]